MAKTYFHEFTRDDGAPITVEYRMDDGACAAIISAWPRTEEYIRLWTRKNAIEIDNYGRSRHFIYFTEEEREELDDIDRAIADADSLCSRLTDAERERMEGWLSENHIQESDDDWVF